MTQETSRYDRQERIERWQQDKLTDARVAIVGSGPLSQFTALSLLALGVGTIDIYEGPTASAKAPASMRDAYRTLDGKLEEINRDAKVRRNRIPAGGLEQTDIGESDLILELSNSPKLKGEVLDYAAEHGKSMISASSTRTSGELCFLSPEEDDERATLTQYARAEQGGFASEVLGGMIAEEVRKHLMPLKDGETPVRNLAYSAAADRRFARIEDTKTKPGKDLSEKHVLIIGAGALGNFVALGAALEGVGRIDILDFDDVESHNLNRQVLFYDAVGKAKSTALADRIREFAPKADVRGLVGKLDEHTDYFTRETPDLILDCVDNLATRAIANYFAIRKGIPLVSGGTNHSSGQVVVYEPGETACLDCKLGVEKALGIALQGSKCTNAPNPSVIMTNEIVGGMMVGEALKVLDSSRGAPVARMLKYDSTIPVRGGLIGASEACDCERGDIGEWIAEVKDRFSMLGRSPDDE